MSRKTYKIDRKFVETVVSISEDEDWNLEAFEVLECFDELKLRMLKPTRENIFLYFNGDLV